MAIPHRFPLNFLGGVIKLFSFVGDTVFDLFLGSGSLLIACAQNNRKRIGVEIDEGYCELAKKD